MKNILCLSLILTILALSTINVSRADRLISEHPVSRENDSVEVTQGHPWWDGDSDLTTRDGDITTSAEKRIHDVSESQAKATVSSSVKISCNIDGSFVGIAQVRGIADTLKSATLAASYEKISDGGIPETLTTDDLDAYRKKPGKGNVSTYSLSLPGEYSSLLYTTVKRHGVYLRKGGGLFGFTILPDDRQDLNLDGNGYWKKTKSGTSLTDIEIIAMFSPYAEASGSAQNNAGQSIGNQVPSVSVNTNMDSDDDDDGNSDTQTNNYVAPPSTSTDNTQITGECGVHAIATSESSDHEETTGACGDTYYVCSQGDHDKLQASCSTDSNCISTNFYLCQHTSHTYGQQACGHTYDPGSSSEANSHRSVTHPCGRHSYYACQTPSSSETSRHTHQTLPCGTHNYYPCRVLPKHKRAITCPRDSNGQSCSYGSYYPCSPHTHAYPSSNNNNNGNSGNSGNDNTAPPPSSTVSCGRSACTVSVSSSNEHRVGPCSACDGSYWSCSWSASYWENQHRVRTCRYGTCGQSWQRCISSTPNCSSPNRPGKKCWAQ